MKVMRRMNGVFPPIGTVVGSDWSGMRLTVDGVDERGVTLRPSTVPDYEAVITREDPQSLTEVEMLETQRMYGAAK
jgi:hypothetical protein